MSEETGIVEVADSEENGKGKKPPTVVTPVLMSDGTTVNFAGKRKMLRTTLVEADRAGCRFDFFNGETRTMWVTPSDPMMFQLAAHGLAQKIGDESGGSESVEDMVMATDKMMERLTKGQWGVERSAGDSFAGAGIVVRALFDVTNAKKALAGKPPTTIEKIRAYVENIVEQGKDKGFTRQKVYQSFRNSPDVAARIKELETEKVQKEAVIDGEEALAALVDS